jgi:hypothetical protein
MMDTMLKNRGGQSVAISVKLEKASKWHVKGGVKEGTSTATGLFGMMMEA